jgi:hypothetical protein
MTAVRIMGDAYMQIEEYRYRVATGKQNSVNIPESKKY